MTATFHRLAVAAVEPLTADAVRIVFSVPEDLREAYRFSAGQHLTIRYQAPDGDGDGNGNGDGGGAVQLRRSYSLCAAPPARAEGPPRRLAIAVKRHGPGGFADYAVRKLAVGDGLDVLTPVGGFHAPAGAPASRRVVAIAAGSGITPILALVTDALRADPAAGAALLYGNRTAADVMFLDELADLKDRYGPRFEVVHVLSREDRGSPLLTGRIDREKLPRLLAAIGAGPQDTYYLCGPFGLVGDARAVLAETGAEHVRFELFDTGGGAKQSPDRSAGASAAASAGPSTGPSTDPAAPRSQAARISVTLGGRTTHCELSPQDDSLLAAVLRGRPEVPYACTDGVCGTCRARLTSGTVDMARDYALEPEEKMDGFVLTCQSLPTSAEVSLDFDA